MSDFKFPCPKCGQSIVCDTSNAGMNVNCPGCQIPITVPKPPAPEPVPGKLSIRPSAPHAPAAPPPGTAFSPKPTSWGSKPAVAPPKKKPAWIMPVVICAVLAALAAGWFLIGAPMLKEREEKEKQKQEEAARLKAEQERAAAEAAKPKKPKIFWSLDSAKAEIPQTPAAGKLHGVNFTVEDALFQNGSLVLRQDTGSSRQFVIALPVKSGEPITGKSFTFTPDDTNHFPTIVMNWKDDASKVRGVEKITKGYLLKLELGDADNGNIPGGIFLSVPDAEQSFVAGRFTIMPRAIPGQPRPPVSAKPQPPTHSRGKP